METKDALSQITETLHRLRAFDSKLHSKITGDLIQRYVDFCQRDQEHVACPVCFLTKGRISYLRSKLPQPSPGEEDLMCDVCTTRIPITVPSQSAA